MVDRVRVLNKGLLSTVTQQWRIQERDPGDPASPPPYFWTKLRPQGPKKRLLRPPPSPLSQGLDDRPPPYLKVWIRHCSAQPEYQAFLRG